MPIASKKTTSANAAAPVTPPVAVAAVPPAALPPSTLDTADEDASLTTATYEPPRRKIVCNPSAGDVHRRERGSPWRVDVDEKIRVASAKAKDEQLEKRRWGLAKQIQDGLVHSFSINYGVAELATLIKTGLALKARQQQQQQTSGVTGAAVVPLLASHEVVFVQLVTAAEKYDLKQVVALLDKFPKGRTSTSSDKLK